MKYQSVIFDSEKDNWKKGNSVFDDKVLKQEKLAFVVEINDGIIIGGFMKKKITGINRKIGDPDCFIFTNRNNQWKKYPIQPSKKYDAFQLSTKQDNYLFIFGNDLFICKEDSEIKSKVNERNSFFNYGRDKNALVGKVGEIEVKRIQVIQFV